MNLWYFLVLSFYYGNKYIELMATKISLRVISCILLRNVIISLVATSRKFLNTSELYSPHINHSDSTHYLLASSPGPLSQLLMLHAKSGKGGLGLGLCVTLKAGREGLGTRLLFIVAHLQSFTHTILLHRHIHTHTHTHTHTPNTHK